MASDALTYNVYLVNNPSGNDRAKLGGLTQGGPLWVSPLHVLARMMPQIPQVLHGAQPRCLLDMHMLEAIVGKSWLLSPEVLGGATERFKTLRPNVCCACGFAQH